MPTYAGEKIHVVGRNDSFLDHEGIGHIDVDGKGNITQVRCGIFAVHKPIPNQGEEYVISGRYDPERKIEFKKTMRCTTAGRPQSIFN